MRVGVGIERSLSTVELCNTLLLQSYPVWTGVNQ